MLKNQITTMSQTGEKKLYLLDAYALIYRSYYAFIKNPRINSKGLNTSAIFGFTNTLIDVIKNQKPSHLAVVFDAPSSTAAREADFAAYKANREETPEDIKKAVPYIIDIIKAFNIPVLMAEGYEADDVIGTLAKVAEKNGFITYMMTPDKDFAQLVSENIFMFKPARSGKPAEIWGVKEVCENFEVERPEQVIDILGLWGDAVDNIPGIPGIGEKTAKKLVAQYGSVEGLIAHADELKGKQKENVINFADQGLLSKKLATILLDAPVPFVPEDLILEDPNEEKVVEIFSDLEFRNLAKRVFGVEIKSSTSGQLDMFGRVEEQENSEVEVTELKTIQDVKVSYKLISSIADIDNLVMEVLKQKEFCFDTETTSIDTIEAELVGVSISFNPNEAVYIAIEADFDKAKSQVERLQPIFSQENIMKIAHNIKYDMVILEKYGIEIKGAIFDTMIAHYLLNPDMKHNMDILAETYLNYRPISITELIGKKGKKQLSMRDVEPEKVVDYACEDADITLQLKRLFAPQIQGTHLEKILFDIELPLVKVLSNMEQEGINLDLENLKLQSDSLEKDITKIENKIYELSGEEFNIDSPKQLGEVLFDKMEIKAKIKKTATGQYSTNEETLLKIADKHEIINYILDYRSLKKLKSTYVDALPELVNPITHRIHTSFMQTVAATGRLSSNNPNLQNIPIRTEQGRKIREAFVAKDENYTLLAADYSQVELRIMAALSQDEGMIEAFNSGTDIHTATAAKVFNVEPKDVDRDMRSKAKMVNFGIIYGISAFGLSQRLGISRTEAKEIIDNYFLKYPKVKQFMDDSVSNAREKGYVETILGRRRNLKDINSANAIVRGHAERNAINAPIQGSAADIIKIAMIHIDREMSSKKLKSKMLLQVHDELVFDVLKEELDVVSQIVKDGMENAVKIAVPLEVEVNHGYNWLEAH